MVEEVLSGVPEYLIEEGVCQAGELLLAERRIMPVWSTTGKRISSSPTPSTRKPITTYAKNGGLIPLFFVQMPFSLVL
jgi:hypothetical protein